MMRLSIKPLLIGLLLLILGGCAMNEPVNSIPPPAHPTQTMTSSDGSSTASNTANADVEYVIAEQQSDGSWTFTVTVSHPDTGWEDYADGWDVVLTDGTVLKRSPDDPFTRILLHPHVDEQPFTRSQSGLEIPEGSHTVSVRAHDLVDGYGGRTVNLDLNQSQGESYEVRRATD